MTILSKPGADIPSAVWVYDWPMDPKAPPMVMYRVSGGPYDGSDVSAETLKEIGIAVPSRAGHTEKATELLRTAPTNGR